MNNNPQKLTPFKHFCLNIGVVPSAYIDAMTYYELLEWLCNYLQETVIPTVNNNSEVVTELQDSFTELQGLFTQLQNYVANYFDNLDVQQEINNKLDEMVLNGTLLTLITPLVQDTINTLSSEVTTNIANMQNEIGSNVLDKYRTENYKYFTEVVKPVGVLSSSFFDNFKITTNGERKYSVIYNINNFKNTGGTTYYISPDGSNTNDGLSEEHPKRSLAQILSICSAGDTVVYLDGVYDKDMGLGTVTKSLNIIGKNPGKVWLKTGSSLSYSLADGYQKTYVTTRSGVYDVIDITKREEGIFTHLQSVTSVEEVEATENSYFTSGSSLYVHLFDDVVPSNDTLDVSLVLGIPNLQFNAFTGDTKIYVEGINMLDGNTAGILANNTTNYDVYLTVRNCNIYNVNSSNYTYDGISNKGCFSLCENVGIYNGGKDGFNYHAGTNKQAIGIEIDCIANNFGLGRTSESQLSNNASTAHEYSQVIRVNGKYSYCNGGVIADVNNARSLNYGCYIFDSYGQSYDVLSQSNSLVYLYNCYLKGSRATTNLLASGVDAYLYYKDTEFDTKSGANVIDLDA